MGISPYSAVIEQGYRDSWSLYRRSLETPSDVLQRWDWIVLTAGDERQAEAFKLQIDWRRRAGLLPRSVHFAVVADPHGRRVGSGGATVHALAEIAREEFSDRRRSDDPSALFRGKRVLILHSGGESRRLPHCSAFGKIFARVPRELPDGRASTLFDEFLIALSGLPFRMHEGVLVASGDVLLLFDHRQLDLSRQGVVGIAARAPLEMGTRHGVYLLQDETSKVRRFLHKVSREELRSSGAVDSAGTVAIDTGMVWFDPAVVGQLLEIFGIADDLRFTDNGLFAEIVEQGANVNLYGDVLAPLAAETDFHRYLADRSDGEPSAVHEKLRTALWQRFRGVPFRAQTLFPAEFIHFGTTSEYIAAMTAGLAQYMNIGWQTPVASFVASADAEMRAVVIGSLVEARNGLSRTRCVIEDSRLGDVELGHRCLVSHTIVSSDFALEPNVAVHQLPVHSGVRGRQGCFVTRIFGVEDNPKVPFDRPEATFLNRPWQAWLAEAAISAEDVWPDVASADRSLWNARLFPAVESREDSLALVLWMQRPAEASEGVRRRWLSAQRMSLAESARRADLPALIDDLRRLDDQVRVERFYAEVVRERPSCEAATLLGDRPADVRRRSAMAAARFSKAADPLLPIRGFKYLADALAAQSADKACLRAGRRYEDRAFDHLAAAIRQATPRPEELASRASGRTDRPRRVVVKVAARVDFAGGWSDTPPFSIEYGGAVLNAAIQLRADLPICVECRALDEPVLVLESRDLDVRQQFETTEPIFDYADPSDPLALHKAAVVVEGIVALGRKGRARSLARCLEEAVGGGLHVATEVRLPQGSGLGTSSILAGGLIACLRRLLGRPVDFAQIYDEVLCLEQMLTTGGGWQDQVGGMVGGIKLTTTEPGLPQRLMVEPLQLDPQVAERFERRLVVIYTGQRRLAKGILRAIMGRFMSREREIVRILCDIREIARAERRALECGDIDEMGRLMAEHWEMNKRLDPGITNPFIDRLFQVCAPYVSGSKLAGAGGGGFMIAVARDPEAADQLGRVLGETFAETGVAVWPCAIADPAIVVSTFAD